MPSQGANSSQLKILFCIEKETKCKSRVEQFTQMFLADVCINELGTSCIWVFGKHRLGNIHADNALEYFARYASNAARATREIQT